MPVKKVKSQKLKVKSVAKAKAVKKTTAKVQKSASVAVKSAPRTSVLTASVYDVKGKAVGRITLPSEIFGLEENKSIIAQAVRVYRANQRTGTASVKTRGEVQGSTRKIYRQKGTGRARHGGIRAPIFVHGGIAHGPKPRDFSLTFPQKMRRVALYSALSGKLRDGEIKVLDLEKISPKTKIMANALRALEVKGKTLLVTPGGSKEYGNVYKASRNLKDMRILPAVTLNTYDVLDNQSILLMKEAVDALKKHFLGGNK